MARGVKFKVKFRRRREGRTNFRRRLALLKSKKPRLVARVLGNSIIAQIIEYSPKGDRTIVNAPSFELKKYGWKGHNGNLGAAYLAGYLCGAKAKEKKIHEAVFDLGLHTPVSGSNVFGVLKGALDAGLTIPHDKKNLPSDERIMGKGNIAEVKEKITKGLVKVK